jgi:hypothetical protein
METMWNYATNPFQKLLAMSMRRFAMFSKEFMGNLKANSTIVEVELIYNQILPLYNDFFSEYSVHSQMLGQRKGESTNLSDLKLILTAEKTPEWSAKIQSVFNAKSPTYAKIFPKGRRVFSTGSIFERIKYLKASAQEVKLTGNLDAVYDDMDAFIAKLESASMEKDTKAGDVKKTQESLQQKAQKLATEIFKAYGILISLQPDKPDSVLKYFPVHFFRYPRKTEENNKPYELTIPAKSIVEGGFTFMMDTRLFFYNTGETKLKLWFTSAQDLPAPANYLLLNPEEDKQITVKDLASQNDRFLMIENQEEKDGYLEIVMM